jgi:hypothetical protein
MFRLLNVPRRRLSVERPGVRTARGGARHDSTVRNLLARARWPPTPPRRLMASTSSRRFIAALGRGVHSIAVGCTNGLYAGEDTASSRRRGRPSGRAAIRALPTGWHFAQAVARTGAPSVAGR